MNKTRLKVGILIMPIICHMFTGWITSFVISALMNSGLISVNSLAFNLVAFPISIIPYISLGFATYYSIKLWIKYIENHE